MTTTLANLEEWLNETLQVTGASVLEDMLNLPMDSSPVDVKQALTDQVSLFQQLLDHRFAQLSAAPARLAELFAQPPNECSFLSYSLLDLSPVPGLLNAADVDAVSSVTVASDLCSDPVFSDGLKPIMEDIALDASGIYSLTVLTTASGSQRVYPGVNAGGTIHDPRLSSLYSSVYNAANILVLANAATEAEVTAVRTAVRTMMVAVSPTVSMSVVLVNGKSTCNPLGGGFHIATDYQTDSSLESVDWLTAGPDTCASDLESALTSARPPAGPLLVVLITSGIAQGFFQPHYPARSHVSSSRVVMVTITPNGAARSYLLANYAASLRAKLYRLDVKALTDTHTARTALARILDIVLPPVGTTVVRTPAQTSPLTPGDVCIGLSAPVYELPERSDGRVLSAVISTLICNTHLTPPTPFPTADSYYVLGHTSGSTLIADLHPELPHGSLDAAWLESVSLLERSAHMGSIAVDAIDTVIPVDLHRPGSGGDSEYILPSHIVTVGGQAAATTVTAGGYRFVMVLFITDQDAANVTVAVPPIAETRPVWQTGFLDAPSSTLIDMYTAFPQQYGTVDYISNTTSAIHAVWDAFDGMTSAEYTSMQDDPTFPDAFDAYLASLPTPPPADDLKLDPRGQIAVAAAAELNTAWRAIHETYEALGVETTVGLVCDPAGLISWHPGYFTIKALDVRIRTWYTRARPFGGLLLSSPSSLYSFGKDSLDTVLIKPVVWPGTGTLFGATFLMVPWMTVYTSIMDIAGASLPATAHMFVMDSLGYVVVHPDYALISDTQIEAGYSINSLINEREPAVTEQLVDGGLLTEVGYLEPDTRRVCYVMSVNRTAFGGKDIWRARFAVDDDGLDLYVGAFSENMYLVVTTSRTSSAMPLVSWRTSNASCIVPPRDIAPETAYRTSEEFIDMFRRYPSPVVDKPMFANQLDFWATVLLLGMLLVFLIVCVKQ